MNSQNPSLPSAPLSENYLADEDTILGEIIEKARLSPAEKKATEALASDLVMRMRSQGKRRGGIDAFTQEYALSSEEGVVLMCLAESLLRVPDAVTADRLIRDKIGGADWEKHLGKSHSVFVNASTFALMLTGRVVSVGSYDGVLKKLIARSGEPVIRSAVGHAMRILGGQFVLGRTIDEALRRARPQMEAGYRFSFDMLGEAAYTMKDAERYFDSYRNALVTIARVLPDGDSDIFERPSISIKLSALHPRYEWVQRKRVMDELLPKLAILGQQARDANIAITIDAEEAERLEIMLEFFERLGDCDELAGWDGLGLAIQAYSKRTLPLITWITSLARRQRRRIPVRLVKGAYWDTEIKRAQESGLKDYPLFTRKCATDTSYLTCARAMLSARDEIYPQFATHNAHTLSAVQVFAGSRTDFEYQRLHGMGELLYDLYRETRPAHSAGAGTRVYAPVGTHEDLLAYLVRRLLENGANTSFVNRLADEKAPVSSIIADPVEELASLMPHRNPAIPKPEDIFPERKNSSGFFWSDPAVAEPTLKSMMHSLALSQTAAAIVGGVEQPGPSYPICDPSDHRRVVGTTVDATEEMAIQAMSKASRAQVAWDRMGGHERAQILERAADLYEQNRDHLMALAVREAGKTLPTALGEVREATDFLRYYALQARKHFGMDLPLPGPTGEDNMIKLHGRGVFACISPWNFPLAIFTGQIAGALASGNTVIAKPAEQSPLIAAAATRLLHAAGVPTDVLHLLPGDGPKLGAVLFADERLSGVAFTGSTEAAMAINQALASKPGPIAQLIAETGGLNAMIVDSTALPEQVTRDVISSAFDSAGQRCSALRVLFLQDDVADKMLSLILGAMDEIRIGDPMELTTDVGPVIDDEARRKLQKHVERMQAEATLLRSLNLGSEHAHGTFFAPHAFEIKSISQLKREVFGPVLHVVRYSANRLLEVCDAINSTGYGLTLGVHSRIDDTAAFIRDHVHVGNMYVNRNQIGAVVGAQPFGGQGLSGTGPKAGGPHYLLRFAHERTYTVNTTAAGGNTALLSGSVGGK